MCPQQNSAPRIYEVHKPHMKTRVLIVMPPTLGFGGTQSDRADIGINGMEKLISLL